MKRQQTTLAIFLAVQILVIAAIGISFAVSSRSTTPTQQALSAINPNTVPTVAIERSQPIRIQPLYDDPEVVSDEELAAVLKQIRPRFPQEGTKPNYVEHALRTWGVDAEFRDPTLMSGEKMKDFLVDHGRYLASWGEEVKPLLVERPTGVTIRWGREKGGSVHHDHWLACLTEAGVNLNEAVFTPTRRDMTMNDVVQEALRDFRLDERETEWSAMAFGLWIPPAKSWQTASGRTLTFDDLARRLLRGHKRFGVCSGTHRLYSMMVLLRLDDEFEILSKQVRGDVYHHLENVRDLLKIAQFENGVWPANWMDGANAVENPAMLEEYKNVIATGHHLEWLAIAPKDLHPPREMILKAADWIIENTTSKTEEEIASKFTFYSHVGSALALWRKTRPADYWREWLKTHPEEPSKSVKASKD